MDYMFSSSNFNYDLSNWKPLNLRNSEEIFNESIAPIPYWVNYDNQDKRNFAIENYWLNKELNIELNNNITKEAKPKL